MTDLVGALMGGVNPLHLAKGVVVTAAPLVILVDGVETTPTGCLGSYAPAIGDIVAILGDGGSMLVLGRIL